MNGIGWYQNHMASLQGANQAYGSNEKRTGERREEKSWFGQPEAVYERTSTDEDIQKAIARRENGYPKKTQEKKENSTLENFTVSKKQEAAKLPSDLSDKARKVLEQLKEKYKNMDFFVAHYSTDEEAQQYLSQGTKEYSVVIDPETLEKMAEDEETFQKYDHILANAGNVFQQVTEQLGEDSGKVADLGMSIDGDGNVSLFAELDKQSVKMIESQKKMREARAEEKKEQAEKAAERAEDKKAEKAAEDKKKTEAEQMETWTGMGKAGQIPPQEERMTFRVTGSTVEELVSAIKNAVWE